MINLILLSTVVVLIYKTIVFVLSLLLRRNDIADVSWGLSFILILVTSLNYTGNFNPLIALVSILVVIWGGRLAARIYLRNRVKKEDFRYQKLREEAGKNFLIRSFLQIYILQGLLAVAVSLPVIFIIYFGQEVGLGWLAYAGLIIWLVGFFFEAVGDYQLDKFLSQSENKGHLLQTGLWKYSRHPNYFGEVTMWWGIFLIAVSVPNGYLSILGPATITFLITKVSGVPMLEKKYIGNREFENYKSRTSVFFPLPQKIK